MCVSVLKVSSWLVICWRKKMNNLNLKCSVSIFICCSNSTWLPTLHCQQPKDDCRACCSLKCVCFHFVKFIFVRFSSQFKGSGSSPPLPPISVLCLFFGKSVEHHIWLSIYSADTSYGNKKLRSFQTVLMLQDFVYSGKLFTDATQKTKKKLCRGIFWFKARVLYLWSLFLYDMNAVNQGDSSVLSQWQTLLWLWPN